VGLLHEDPVIPELLLDLLAVGYVLQAFDHAQEVAGLVAHGRGGGDKPSAAAVALEPDLALHDVGPLGQPDHGAPGRVAIVVGVQLIALAADDLIGLKAYEPRHHHVGPGDGEIGGDANQPVAGGLEHLLQLDVGLLQAADALLLAFGKRELDAVEEGFQHHQVIQLARVAVSPGVNQLPEALAHLLHDIGVAEEGELGLENPGVVVYTILLAHAGAGQQGDGESCQHLGG
jgi:hypothetical protein